LITLWRVRLKPTTRTPDKLSDRSLSTPAMPSRTWLYPRSDALRNHNERIVSAGTIRTSVMSASVTL
jgi:hypothetical protein